MSSGSPDSATQRNGPCLRRRADECIPARSRESRTRLCSRHRTPSCECCCRSRKPLRRRASTPASRRRGGPSIASSACDVFLRDRACAIRLLRRESSPRYVAVQRIVRAGLVGERIRLRLRGARSPEVLRRNCPPGQPKARVVRSSASSQICEGFIESRRAMRSQ